MCCLHAALPPPFQLLKGFKWLWVVTDFLSLPLFLNFFGELFPTFVTVKIAPSFTTQLLDKLLLRRINALSLTLIKTPRVGDRNTLLLYILMCSLKVDGGMDWGFCSSTRQTLLGRQSNKFSLKNEEMF